MRTKSFPVKSRRNSHDPYPPLPGRFVSGYREINSDTVRPHKKRQSPRGEDIEGSKTVELEACIVCQVSDERVTSCCGLGCLIRYHEECLTPEFGGSEDLKNPFCPYCWFQLVVSKSKSLREEAVEAEKAVSKYLDKGIFSGQGEHGECSSKEGTGIEEDIVVEDEVEAEGDDESAQVQTIIRRRRRVEMNATDSEISSTMEPDEEDVSEPSAANNVTARSAKYTQGHFFFFDKNHKGRPLWTSKEEEMLKMGVEKFVAEAKRNIPWRKILEWGDNVFHQGRRSADLKDKWRNMHKA